MNVILFSGRPISYMKEIRHKVILINNYPFRAERHSLVLDWLTPKSCNFRNVLVVCYIIIRCLMDCIGWLSYSCDYKQVLPPHLYSLHHQSRCNVERTSSQFITMIIFITMTYIQYRILHLFNLFKKEKYTPYIHVNSMPLFIYSHPS